METWTLLSVKPSEFWTNKVRNDDRPDGSPSSPEITFLRLDLGPALNSDRDENDTLSVLFRVRIVFHEGQWIPWFPDQVSSVSDLSYNDMLTDLFITMAII